MSRKQSSQTVLLALYTEEEPIVTIGYEHIASLLPTLSSPGRRSLMAHLQDEGVVSREQLGRKSFFRITDRGKETVKRLFPAFSDYRHDWKGQWALVSFINAPTGDKQFRYLRQLLTNYQAVKLSRGDYLLPYPLEPVLMSQLKTTYWKSVFVGTIGQTLIGDVRGIVFEQLAIEPVATALSGVSTEVETLLGFNTPFSSLKDQQKSRLFSVFARFVSAVRDGTGLEQHYFPQVAAWENVLRQFQRLFSDDN